MKKILFLIPNLMHGGAEKVLVNLVNNLNPSKYEITLFSIFDQGVNKEFLNQNINYQYKFKKVFRGNSHFFKLFSPEFLYKWLIKEEYDIAISSLEGPAARIISGCQNPATKKITWIHTEIQDQSTAKVGFRTLKDAKKYYEKFDRIVGVSQKVVEGIQKFITTKIPTHVLYNVNDTETIIEKGKESKTFFALEKAKTDYFHIDVMDGKFVEKNTVDKMNQYSNILKQITTLPLDVHLMVEDVETYIKLYSAIEPNMITFHLEAIKDKEKIYEMIKLVKDNNCKVDIAIKPNTEVKEIYEFLPDIKTVLVMTVEPGKGGQALIPETLRKIRILKEYLNQHNLDTYIEADGGINLDTIDEVKESGVDIAVVGNGILKTENYRTTVSKLKN